jgi:hypothetical protein
MSATAGTAQRAALLRLLTLLEYARTLVLHCC